MTGKQDFALRAHHFFDQASQAWQHRGARTITIRSTEGVQSQVDVFVAISDEAHACLDAPSDPRVAPSDPLTDLAQRFAKNLWSHPLLDTEHRAANAVRSARFLAVSWQSITPPGRRFRLHYLGAAGSTHGLALYTGLVDEPVHAEKYWTQDEGYPAE